MRNSEIIPLLHPDHLFTAKILKNTKRTWKAHIPNALESMRSNSQDAKLFFVGVKAVATPNYISQTAGIQKRKKNVVQLSEDK